MSLILYNIFNTVAKKGSFQKTADKLGFTPSAISHSISRLEEQLGFRLFTREKSGVCLTAQGQQILPYIQKVLDWDCAARDLADRLNHLETGFVKLGVFHGFSATWLVDIEKTFNASFPGIKLYTIEGTFDELEEWLSISRLDIAILKMPICRKFDVQELFCDRLLAVTPKDIKPANGKIMTCDELHNYSFIFMKDIFQYKLEPFFAENNISVKYKKTLSDRLSLFIVVENGMGVTIVPEIFLDDMKSDCGIYPIENIPVQTIGIATLPPEFVSPITSELKKIIHNVAKKYR